MGLSLLTALLLFLQQIEVKSLSQLSRQGLFGYFAIMHLFLLSFRHLFVVVILSEFRVEVHLVVLHRLHRLIWTHLVRLKVLELHLLLLQSLLLHCHFSLHLLQLCLIEELLIEHLQLMLHLHLLQLHS